MKLEFEESPLQVDFPGFEISQNEPLIQGQVNKLLKKGVTVEFDIKAVKYISPILLRKKTIRTQKLILNLKSLNNYLEYKHFKTQAL